MVRNKKLRLFNALAWNRANQFKYQLAFSQISSKLSVSLKSKFFIQWRAEFMKKQINLEFEKSRERKIAVRVFRSLINHVDKRRNKEKMLQMSICYYSKRIMTHSIRLIQRQGNLAKKGRLISQLSSQRSISLIFNKWHSLRIAQKSKFDKLHKIVLQSSEKTKKISFHYW